MGNVARKSEHAMHGSVAMCFRISNRRGSDSTREIIRRSRAGKAFGRVLRAGTVLLIHDRETELPMSRNSHWGLVILTPPAETHVVFKWRTGIFFDEQKIRTKL